MRYQVTTKLTSQEVLRRAIDHFGPQGVGLEIVDKSDACLILQGGGGHVSLTVCPGDSSQKTTIEFETREWDRAVRQFIDHV